MATVLLLKTCRVGFIYCTEIIFMFPILNVVIVCPVCVSLLLCHAVVLEVYQDKLVTEGDLEKMKGEGGDLPDRLVSVQCIKSQDEGTRTADVLVKFGCNESARKLKGW